MGLDGADPLPDHREVAASDDLLGQGELGLGADGIVIPDHDIGRDIGIGDGVLARWARVTVNATCGAGSASLDIQGVDIVTAGHAPADGTDVCCDPARGCTGRACPAGQRCLWHVSNPNGVNSFDNAG